MVTTREPRYLGAMKERLILYLKGFAMGSADVVPGVSGGTMALITGIYTELLDAIKSFDLQAVRDLLRLRFAAVFARVEWKFLAVLLSGIFTAVIFFTRVVKLPVLMRTDPAAVYGLFFGLIVGSIWFVAKDIGKFDLRAVAFTGLGTIVGYWVVNLVPTETPENAFFIFFSGAVAICAMVLPGISGSFILLILRKYEFILGQIALLGTADTLSAVGILIPFGLGILTGITLFTRFLSWLLHHYTKQTMAVLVGFMIGSLWVIWPWQNRTYVMVRDKERLLHSVPELPVVGSADFTWGVAMMVVGLVLVMVLERLARRRNA